jgi:hypothetical protein
MSIRTAPVVVAALSFVAGCGAQPPAHTAADTATTSGTGMSPAQISAGTVDTFEGKWTMELQVTPPGETKASPAKMDLTCDKTAGGKAVRCTYTLVMGGQPAGEGAMLIGYDGYNGKVHFMSMTSDDEFHDHVCTWNNIHDLDCGVYEGGMGGQKVSEELHFTCVRPGVLTFASKVRFPDGKSFAMKGTGQRVSQVAATP